MKNPCPFFMPKTALLRPIGRMVLTFVASFGIWSSLFAQPCTFDDVPPLPICDVGLTVEVIPGETFTLTSEMIDEGSFDNCTNPEDLQFFLEEGLPSSNAPGTTTLVFDDTDAGLHAIVMWVEDTWFNQNYCVTTLEITLGQAPCHLTDVVPPTPVCAGFQITQLGYDGPELTIVEAAGFDGGSFDDCSLPDELLFRLEEAATPSASPPATDALPFDTNGIGLHDIVVWIGDVAGNWATCSAVLEVLPVDCVNDIIPPTCIAPPDTIASLNEFMDLGIDPLDTGALELYFGAATAWDNCGVVQILPAVELQNNDCGFLSVIKRNFVAVDAEGGSSQPCTQEVRLLPEYTVHVPAYYYPGDPQEDSLTYDPGPYSLFIKAIGDVNYNYNCDDEPDFINRKWSAINWCIGDPDNSFDLPVLDLNNDGITGDAYDFIALPDSIYLLDNGVPTIALGPRTDYYRYDQHLRFNYDDTVNTIVTGTVFLDTLADCIFSGSEPVLANWPVRAVSLTTGAEYHDFTNSSGVYEFEVCSGDTTLEVSLEVPFNYGAACGTTWTVTLPYDQPAVADIPVYLETDCPLLYVDIAAPFLRRCFQNYYVVSYTNLSNELVEEAYVEVELDTFMNFIYATQTSVQLDPQLFRFPLGDLEPGASGAIFLYFDLDCAAPLGLTHCSEAHIYPDTICGPAPLWTGATVEVDGFCDGDTVRLNLSNIGTGNMAGQLDYIVVEDIIMYQSDQFQLDVGEQMWINLPANGATWRLEAEQEPFHPWGGMPSVTVEGCGGLNTTGLVILFPFNDPDPFVAVDCQENIGAYDPNDKRGFPAGYGEEHYIETNTPLDYLIRFQNTGTDTAFQVVVLDTLSAHLDAASVLPGAASHPYQFELLEENILRFTFNDIMLPDSNVNEIASHGFVKFAVRQMPDNPVGTLIENSAAIYFDFNEAVITNTTQHLVGEHFVEVINGVVDHDRPPLRVYPNPSAGEVQFELPAEALGAAVFTLHDQLGRLMRVDTFEQGSYILNPHGLPPGWYSYSIRLEGTPAYSGKVILK